ncbi:MAG TPA: hypothetical protein PLV92_29320, partial [Pirellulaceae bacterium]|nr:hypothetical protein [Pirellulaceae bacterium]
MQSVSRVTSSIAARSGENIAVDAVAGQVRVRRAGTTDTSFGSIVATQVRRLLVHGDAGGASIDLTGVTAAAFTNLTSITARDGGGGDRLLGGDLPARLDAAWGEADGSVDADQLTGGAVDDTLVSRGPDSLRGGAGRDALVVRDALFQLADGGAGFDTLALAADDLVLDLSAIAGSRIVDVEQLDLTAAARASVRFSRDAVLAMSSSTDTLVVLADASDSLQFDGAWQLTDASTSAGSFYRTVRSGSAAVQVGGVGGGGDWRNPLRAMDVDNDTFIVPGDVLQIVNELNRPTVID